MLDRKKFEDEIEKIVIEFGDKGFNMNSRRANQWYSFFKEVEEGNFKNAVDLLLRTCDKNPSMANLMTLTTMNKPMYPVIRATQEFIDANK